MSDIINAFIAFPVFIIILGILFITDIGNFILPSRNSSEYEGTSLTEIGPAGKKLLGLALIIFGIFMILLLKSYSS